MRIANLLDVTTTELPIWTVEQLTAVCLGPYQRDLAPGYASDYRYKDTVRAQGPAGGGTYHIGQVTLDNKNEGKYVSKY